MGQNPYIVYVIGLHAVQFGNNRIQKIPRTAKFRPRPIWQSEEFFESDYFQIGQACSPITYSLSIRLFEAGGGGGDGGRRKGREKPDTSALIQAFHPRAT